MTGTDAEQADWEYGRVAVDAVQWLRERGFLAEGDCSMDVACGRGGFARPMSRVVRVLVCMDTDRGALDLTGQRCQGGCRTELFQQDWNSYSPRGGYDSCLISPSYICFNGESIMKAEKVALRSCVVVFPLEFDYRRLRKAFLQSLGAHSGFVDMPNFPDSRPLAIWLADTGRKYEVKRFETTVDCPESTFREAIVRDSIAKGVDRLAAEAMAGRFVSGLSRGGSMKYRFSANVVAWNVNEG